MAIRRADPLALAAGTLPGLQASKQCLTLSRFFAQALRRLIGRPPFARGLVDSVTLLPLKPWRGALIRRPP
jgi:hypothetical protein